MRLGWLCAGLLGVTLPALGCSLEVPQGPDLSKLARSYDHPAGELDEAELEAVVAAARLSLSQVKALGGLDFFVETLTEVASVLKNYSENEDDAWLDIDVVSNTTTSCPGLAGASATDPANGTLDFTLAIENSVVRPTIWGSFSGCRMEHEGLSALIDSEVAILLTGTLELRDLALETFLFRLDGALDFNGAERSNELTFRVLADRTIEVSVPTSSGNVIFRFGAEDTVAAVRSKELSYCCDFEGRSCIRVERDSCDSPQVGDQELSW